MHDVPRIGATTPADLIATLAKDAGRMRAVVAVVLTEDGSWHVRHSTAPQSIIDAAAINLMRELIAK